MEILENTYFGVNSPGVFVLQIDIDLGENPVFTEVIYFDEKDVKIEDKFMWAGDGKFLSVFPDALEFSREE